MAGNGSCRSESAVCIQPFTLFLSSDDLSLLLGSISASLVAHCVGPVVLFQGSWYCTNMMKTTRELLEIAIYCNLQLTGEMNCSRGDNEPHVAWRFKQILATLALSAVATGDPRKLLPRYSRYYG